MVKKRKEAKEKIIEDYNNKLHQPTDPKPGNSNLKKVNMSSIMSQIQGKNDQQDKKAKEKINLSSWRKYEEEKEQSELTNDGKIKFDEFDFIDGDDNKEKNSTNILTLELDTLDDDNELTLLRKRKQFHELSAKR